MARTQLIAFGFAAAMPASSGLPPIIGTTRRWKEMAALACGKKYQSLMPASWFMRARARASFGCYNTSADIDRLMGKRTESRPVAAGRIPPARAIEFGLALSALSFVILASALNVLTATLALVGNLFYVVVYTRWLKRSTPQNIVIGGAAGAVPPLVGFAAATGNLALPALWGSLVGLKEVWRVIGDFRTQIKWWHWLWLLSLSSSFVFRYRSSAEISQTPFDSLAALRVGPEIICACVLQGIDTSVKSGDEVSIVPAVAGG